MARSAPIAKAWRKVSDASVAVNHGTVGNHRNGGEDPHLVGARRNSHQLRNMSFPQLLLQKNPECPENSRIKKSWYVYNHKKAAMDVDNRYKQCNLYITDIIDIVLYGCGNCPST